MQAVITIDNGTSPCAIKVTCKSIRKQKGGFALSFGYKAYIFTYQEVDIQIQESAFNKSRYFIQNFCSNQKKETGRGNIATEVNF